MYSLLRVSLYKAYKAKFSLISFTKNGVPSFYLNFNNFVDILKNWNINIFFQYHRQHRKFQDQC